MVAAEIDSIAEEGNIKSIMGREKVCWYRGKGPLGLYDCPLHLSFGSETYRMADKPLESLKPFHKGISDRHLQKSP